MTEQVHKAAFEGDAETLRAAIRAATPEGANDDSGAGPAVINSQDVHGNTPLLIAVMLGHRECVKVLLDNGADVMSPGGGTWPPITEAVSLGDRPIAEQLLARLDQHMQTEVAAKSSKFFNAVTGIQDCWVEMDWDVHSWVPLVSRVLPSDTIQIWKKGNRLRMDSTLIDVSEKSLKRGLRSVVITATLNEDNEPVLEMVTIDHGTKTYAKEVLFDGIKKQMTAKSAKDKEDDLNALLANDLVDADVTTSSTSFPRAQSGWLGWKADRVETVEGRECRVHNVDGLSFITITRREHLSPEDIKFNKDFTQAMARDKVPDDFRYPDRLSLPRPAPHGLSWEQYRTAPTKTHLGRPMQKKEKVKTLKGTVYMCDDFPLTLDELSSLITVVASKAEQIKKVRAFLDNQLPAGFPVKLEVPVFPTVSVRVTTKQCITGAVDESVFNIPDGMAEVTIDQMIGADHPEDGDGGGDDDYDSRPEEYRDDAAPDGGGDARQADGNGGSIPPAPEPTASRAVADDDGESSDDDFVDAEDRPSGSAA